MFKKVAIVGTGLIGGSLALAIKRKRLAKEVVGVSRHKSSIRRALAIKAIDRGSTTFEIVRGADLLILATPVDVILTQAKKLSSFVADDCVVMDVGSIKTRIVSRLTGIFSRFVGTHPMAGSEKRGVEFAHSHLFCGSTCIISPVAITDKTALKVAEKFWRALNTKVVFMSPREHDRSLAFLSHLPHAAAFSLIKSIPRKDLPLAAGGLKDTTRIAASVSEIWSEIFLNNRDNLLKAISVFESNLAALKSAIRKQDRAALTSFINQARSLRQRL